MITYEKAIQNVKKKYPDKKIGGCYDMNQWYLINIDSDDYDADFYAVNKSDGAVKTYSPLADLNSFKEAMRKRIV